MPASAALIGGQVIQADLSEDDLLAVPEELGVGFVAHSPLGRGFLTGQIQRFEDLAPDDFRRLSREDEGFPGTVFSAASPISRGS